MSIVIAEKNSTAVHYLAEDAIVEDVLVGLGLTAQDVTVYPDRDSWVASPAGAARVAARQQKIAVRDAKSEAKRRVANDVDPDLASTTALAVIHLLWPAVDSTKIPAKVKQAVNIYAAELGLPQVT